MSVDPVKVDQFFMDMSTSFRSKLIAGEFEAVAPTPNPEPDVEIPDAGLENPYGSTSGIPATDNPYAGPAYVDSKTLDEVSQAAAASADNSPQGLGLRVVTEALKQQGKRYRLGATGPNEWDCSALAQWAYKTALGINLPRTTYDQIKEGREVKFSEAIDGDLIFSNFSSPGRPEHVSINMSGPDNVVEAGDPVGIYKWGNRGTVVVKRYTT